MKWFSRFVAWFRENNGKKRFEGEMNEELRFHLDSMVEENIRAGMSSEGARRMAQIEFGGLDQIKEDCRDTRWTRWLDQFWQDLRYTLRILSGNPLSSVITVVLIAAAIGLLCATYAVLDAVLLRTLPVPHPEQLVVINPTASLDASIYDALEQERQNISEIFGLKSTLLYGIAGNASRPLAIYGINGDYFGAVGAVPQLGRFLAADEHDAVAIISDRLWRREFAQVPDILGRTIRLNSLEVTIVGVARTSFILVEEPYTDWDVIIPSDVFCRAQGHERMPLQIVARLKAGRTADKYEAQLNTIWPALLQATVPPKMTLEQWRERIGRRAQVVSISHGINYVLTLNPGISLAIRITFALSILIFLSGCLALVLLAIARSARDQHQTAIMLAMGGRRWRVQQPFFLEILILSGLGCAAGLVIAWWWSRLGTSFLPGSEFTNWHVRIDERVVTLALFTTLLIAALITSITVLSCFSDLSNRTLHSGGRAARPHVRLRLGLLTAQVAMSVLLVHYGLFFTVTFSKLLHTPLGFDPENLHVYTLLSRLPERNVPDSYFHTLICQIQQLPDVESAAIILGQPPMRYPLEYKQTVKTGDGREAQATIIYISPGYFDTLHLPLLSGRGFSWDDRNTAIVNETLLKKLNSGQDLLGNTIAFGKSGTPLQIIGVAGKMTHFGPRWGHSTIAFVPYTALQGGGYIIMVRSKRNLEELRRAVQTLLDPQGIYYIADSVDQKTLLSDSMRQERMLATMAGAFGGLIVLLVGVELFAFCNYLLAMRTKELAIRASVGAGLVHITRALLKEIMKALGIGLAIGFALIYMGERVFANQVGLESAPVFTYQVFAIAIVAGVAMSAVLAPVFQARRINLAQALRVD